MTPAKKSFVLQFRNALPLIKEEYKKHIHFIGLGGQRIASVIWGIGNYENYIHWDDFVPLINFINPLHFEDIYFSLSDDNTNSSLHGNGWSMFEHSLDAYKETMERKE